LLALITYLIFGFLIGIVSGVFGVGGGFILVPALNIIASFPIKLAISNSLFYVTVISLSGAITHVRNKNVVIPVAVICSVVSVITTQLGIYLLGKTPPKILVILFCLLLTIVSINFFTQALKRTKKTESETEIEIAKEYVIKEYFVSSVTGIFSGIASGLFGIGGGTIIIPMLNFFLKTPLKRAIGTSTLVIFFTGLSGTITHLINKNISLDIMIPLSLGGMLGIQAGIRILTKMPERTLKLLFGILLIFICLNLLWRNN